MAIKPFKIEDVAKYVIKYAPQFGIRVASPIIAQAILESASGTSNKVALLDDFGNVVEWRHNYFGLKWRDKRCAISNDFFSEKTSEQKPDGTYYEKIDVFCKFKSLEECIIGYFQWTNTSNYSNLKGVTDPRKYLENIKADKYATSLKYVENLMNVINKYNLTKYDKFLLKDNRISINIHAGHNPDGKVACGAVGFIKESTEARIVKDLVIDKLKAKQITVYDCTCEDGTSQNDILKKIVNKCNEHDVDLDISIHFNAGAKDFYGNKKTTGTEVIVFSKSSLSYDISKDICNAICRLGFNNRGIKERKDLYFLKNTKAPACLIEVCFVDDKDDCLIYNANEIANQISESIINYYKR